MKTVQMNIKPVSGITDLSKKDNTLETSSKLQKRIKQHLCTFILIVAFICLVKGKSQAYVMQAEQLTDLMTRNFSEFKTLIITQSTHLVTPEDLEVQMILEEKIWLRSPGFHHSEFVNIPDHWGVMVNELTAGRPSADMAFRRLFTASDKNTIMALLSDMGVNLNSVAFTRVDGVIAYRVGDKNGGAPKILIEKDRFLPLLLNYRLWKESGLKSVTVRFDDYREVAGGWYPYEIHIFTGDNLEERYFAIDLQVNTPIDSSFFERHGEQNRQKSPEKGQLKAIIDLLKEKHKHTDSSMSEHKSIED